MKKRLQLLVLAMVFLATVLALASCQNTGGTRPTTTEAPAFEVVFVAGDGEILKTETVTLGQSATAPEVPSRPGYVFAGWDTDFSRVDCPLTVTAQYKRVWTVRFVDAQGNEIRTFSVVDGETSPTPNVNPYLEDHTFAGWDQDYSSVTSDMIIRPVFEAVRKLTVTFLGKDGQVLKTQSVYPGGNAMPPAAPAVTHFTFKGWDKEYTNVQEDLTVNAVYEEDVKYTVSFFYEGHLLYSEEVYAGGRASAPILHLAPHFTFRGWDKPFMNVQSDLDVNAIVEEDAKFTVTFIDREGNVLKSEAVYVGEDATAPEAPLCEGFTFIGWDKGFANIQADLTVTALYRDNNKFSVVFKDRDGNILKAEDVSLGEAATAPEAPAIENHTFAGWDKDFSCVSEDMTVTAMYTENPKYTVQFVDYNGIVLHSEVVYVGKSATAPEHPTRENHTFTGWDKDYSNVQGNLTVTATYSENAKYTVTFVDYNGNILKTETVYVGKSATAPATPIHQNLKFTGWDKSFDSISGDLTVTAQYQRYYTVIFMGHDGAVLKTEDVAEGGAATAPAAPIREGYVFAGWDNAFDVVNADVVVTAQYEIVKHNVSFSVAGGNAPATQVVEHGGVATRPEDPVREGFDFVEWRVSGVKYDFSTPVVGDMTVVAVFQSNGQVPAATNTTLRLDPDRLEMWVGITLQLNVMPYNATKNFMANSDATFDFISTDPEILSIEDDGTFTAHALGSVKVYAVVTKGGSYTGSETYTAAVGDILPAIIIDVVEMPEYYKKAQEESDQKITLGSTSTSRINKNDFLSFPAGNYGDANIALWYNGAEGVFTMTADDNANVVGEWQKWVTVYEEYGIPTTFISPSDSGYTNEGTVWQIITSNTAHAVQSHGATHLAISGEHSTARIWHEFYFGRQQMDAVSGMDALIIGYANGTNYAPISSLFFIGGRGTRGTSNTVDTIDYNQLNSYSGWAGGAASFINTLFGANATNGWVSVHYHNIGSGMENLRANYAILHPYVQSGQLWAPQFAQASQYGQERDTATLTVLESGADIIRLVVTDEMNDILFYHPLSVRVKVDNTWKGARAYQNGAEVDVQIIEKNGETYLMVDAIPDRGEVTVVRTELTQVSQSDSAILFTPVDALASSQLMTAQFAVGGWSYAYATQNGANIPAFVRDGVLYVTCTVNGGEVKVVPLTNQYDNLDAYTMTMIANGAAAPDASKPITISSVEEMMMLSHYVLEGNTLEGITLELTTDLDMTGVDFAPIGRYFVYKNSSGCDVYRPFKGIFNGNGHTISNLTMQRSEGTGGIFGYINGAVISNLHVKGNISAIEYVGGIVGNAVASTVSRCSFEGIVTAHAVHKNKNTGRYVGGIVGNMSGMTVLEHCSVNGTVQSVGSPHSATTLSCVGGIAGGMGAGTINNSGFVGTVQVIHYAVNDSSKHVGGIVGSIDGGNGAGLRTVSNCFAKCTVTGDEYVGGIAGNLYSNSSGTTIKVYNCAVQGTVSGLDRVGGLAGHGQGVSGTVIENSFADVKVNAPATATYVGTILGSFQAESYGLKINTNFYVEGNNPGMPVAVKVSGSGSFSSTAVANGAAALDALNTKAASAKYYSWELIDGVPSPLKDKVYSVVFLGKDGEVLLSTSVPNGMSVNAPTIPQYSGFEFIGWDKAFDNISADITVTALYKEVRIYTVIFLDKNGEMLKSEQVNEGKNATAPTIPVIDGYRFDGWDTAFTGVTSHLTVKAQYVKTWTVTYLNNAGEVWIVEVYDEGTMPTMLASGPAVSGYIFKEWNPASLPAMYENATVSPIYEVRPATSAAEYKVMHWTFGGNVVYIGGMPSKVTAAVTEADPDILILSGLDSGTFRNTKYFNLPGYTCWAYGAGSANSASAQTEPVHRYVGSGVAVFYKTDKFTVAGEIQHGFPSGDRISHYTIFPLANMEGVTVPVVASYLSTSHKEADRTKLMDSIKTALGTNIDGAIIRIYVESSTATGLVHGDAFRMAADESGFGLVCDGGTDVKKTDGLSNSTTSHYVYLIAYSSGKPTVTISEVASVASTQSSATYPNNQSTNTAFIDVAYTFKVSIGATGSVE